MTDMVKELLENNTLTQEVAEALDIKIMNMVTPLRSDLKTLRDEKNTLSDNIKGLSESKDSLEAKFATYDEDIRLAKDAGKADTVKILESERADHKKVVDSLATYLQDNTKLRLENAVSKEMGSYKVKSENSDEVRYFLQSKVSLGDNGAIVYNNGTESVSIKDGFKSYFEKKTNYLDAIGDGNGSGAKDGQGGTGHVPKIEDMTASQKMEAGRSNK